MANYAADFDFVVSDNDLMASMCDNNTVKQHDLTTKSHERAAAELHSDSESDIWQQSRKNSINNSFSGAWLSALPGQGTTFMNNEEFMTACLYSLGLPLPQPRFTLTAPSHHILVSMANTFTVVLMGILEFKNIT
jgi:hypothetical protein